MHLPALGSVRVSDSVSVRVRVGVRVEPSLRVSVTVSVRFGVRARVTVRATWSFRLHFPLSEQQWISPTALGLGFMVREQSRV